MTNPKPLHVELLGPYGDVLAEGDLMVRDTPGEGSHGLSTPDEITLRFRGQVLVLGKAAAYAGPPYGVRFE